MANISAATKYTVAAGIMLILVTAKAKILKNMPAPVNSNRVSFLDRPIFINRKAAWSLLPQSGFLPLQRRIKETKPVSKSGTAKISSGAKNPRLECSLYPVPIDSAAIIKPSRVLPLSPKKVLTRTLWL